MKNFFLTIVIIAMLAILGVVGYTSYNYLQEKNSLQFDLIPSPIDVASSTYSTGSSQAGSGQTASDTNSATSTNQIASSTADTTSWKTYSNDELGYGLKYPSDLIFNYGGTPLILAFPKKSYFHWPLEDDVKITVMASSTCSGPTVSSDYDHVSTSTLKVNGLVFAKTEGSGIGAGNVYGRTTYDIRGNGACYSLILDSHGANGAGLYVSDSALIKKYDDQHATDFYALMNTVYGILGTFEVLKLPEGVRPKLIMHLM